MNPQQHKIEVHSITLLALRDETPVHLEWSFEDGDCEHSATAQVSLCGVYHVGEIHDWGDNDPDAKHQFSVNRFVTAVETAAARAADHDCYTLETNDFIEAVAFAAAGPDPWVSDPLYDMACLSMHDVMPADPDYDGCADYNESPVPTDYNDPPTG